MTYIIWASSWISGNILHGIFMEYKKNAGLQNTDLHSAMLTQGWQCEDLTEVLESLVKIWSWNVVISLHYWPFVWRIHRSVGSAMQGGSNVEIRSIFNANANKPVNSPTGQNGRCFADDIFRCIFTNEKFCRLKFHWSLFLRVQLTITQHWFG